MCAESTLGNPWRQGLRKKGLVVTHMNHTKPGCHAHGYSAPCPPSIPFLRGGNEGTERAEDAGPTKATHLRRLARIQPRAGGSAAKQESPRHTVGQPGTQQIYKCLPITYQQGADSISEQAHGPLTGQRRKLRLENGLNQCQPCPQPRPSISGKGLEAHTNSLMRCQVSHVIA